MAQRTSTVAVAGTPAARALLSWLVGDDQVHVDVLVSASGRTLLAQEGGDLVPALLGGSSVEVATGESDDVTTAQWDRA